MSHSPRRILPERLYELTIKTFQDRYFFVPSERLNAVVLGALAYAANKYGLRFCYTVWMSNHAHSIIRADSAQQVRDVLRLAHCQIAKEVQNICNASGKPWTGGIFQRKKPRIKEIAGGRSIQRERLGYLLSHGVKEGLVPKPSKWPGIHSATAWLTGSMHLSRGRWIDRSSLYEVDRGVRRRKKKVVRKSLTEALRRACRSKVVLPLHPLPYMDEMTPEERHAEIHDLLGEILVEHRAKVATVAIDWKRRICDPEKLTYRPPISKKDIEPEVHAESKEVWRQWQDEWQAWLTAYRNASLRLRKGISRALEEFPPGCFLPSGVFTSDDVALPPPTG